MSARHPIVDIEQAMPQASALQRLWTYNLGLLSQAVVMIERLKVEANADFNYGQAVGPHARHIIEHYQALLNALDRGGSHRIEYDGRVRDLALQSQPDGTLAGIRQLQSAMHLHSHKNPSVCELDTLVQTVFQVGMAGEMDVTGTSTLGRELLFLGSHTVHHFALMAHYCKVAGVDLGPDFGKAPSTVAFERKH